MKTGFCFRTTFLLSAIVVVISCNDQRAPKPADQEMKDLIKKYPDSLLLRENLIQYYRENENYTLAIAETDKAINADSMNDRLWDIRATLAAENNDTLSAIWSFEKAIEIRSEPEYVMSLGSLYAQTKNPLALAMADALLAAPRAKAEKQAYFIKGLYFNYSGNKSKAIEYFDSCLNLDYADLLSYREKAICYYDLGKYTNALEVLQTATAIKHTFDEGYYWKGRCYEKLNKKDDAIANYQMALQIDPGYIEARDALAKMGIR